MGTLAQHQGQCRICKSEHCNEFNERFIAGESNARLCQFYEFEIYTGELHCVALKLVDERYKSARGSLKRFLRHCEDLMDSGRFEIKGGAYIQALKLLAELNKETSNMPDINVIVQNHIRQLEEISDEKDTNKLRNRLADLTNGIV